MNDTDKNEAHSQSFFLWFFDSEAKSCYSNVGPFTGSKMVMSAVKLYYIV